ncbi:type I-E CRISPR-associated protein Cse2/CasB [Bifidobacterium vespertilionis]|uniref:Type I-E CRISPR-associated protein Cse2/CasB n=1 Tax=Bifidobacterium vespertilionis TaxID=2562524 RepID=A0A5J5DSZ5_9BIFI|nr:type I-E CRISPR-associated protein Cse2/CasB [Bifidobacterium vespertilionis]KAA8816707.1 type I-E CRISPR-associated protein Cse2/CasB [Bifidobacterium vespertilionis]KAA8821769.1 type I-E CRISPR-associated protein Cse2/CasB [Bifidobacterium vespertilionis]
MAEYIKLTPFGAWVSARVHQLVTGGRAQSGIRHKGYLQNDSYATAAMAKLRHAAGHEAGADPDVFEWTMPDTDDTNVTGRVDLHPYSPTPQELAAHTAITLFALHQQSIRDMSMHTDENVSLGYAVGLMAYGNFNESGIRHAFDRLQTANSWKETARHARTLVSLLRRERIPLNYGLLAQHLMYLRANRELANGVRLRWGRDFQSAYRRRQTEDRQPQQS